MVIFICSLPRTVAGPAPESNTKSARSGTRSPARPFGPASVPGIVRHRVETKPGQKVNRNMMLAVTFIT
jgi:hypothetical protein